MDFRSKSVKLYYYTILYWFLFLLLPLRSAGRYRQSVNRVYGNSLCWRLIEVQMPAWRCTVILNEKCINTQPSLHCRQCGKFSAEIEVGNQSGAARVMLQSIRCSLFVRQCHVRGTNVSIRTFKKLRKLRFVFWISCSRKKKYSSSFLNVKILKSFFILER